MTGKAPPGPSAHIARLATRALDLARDAGATIATAESCTGGLVAASLTAIPGSSASVECGFVTYSNRAKQEMLDVPAALIGAHGAVSEPVARSMAEGAAARSGAGICISVTGIAGPGGSEFKPEGRVCFGISVAGGAARAVTVEFGALGRDAVREAACAHALHLIAEVTSGFRSSSGQPET
ncbi:CinA family protein [Profundibacterium mesophilum]|uniref:Competence-damaged inducible protein n=1 Tax=Profundibacterium mesophilum KAUST100406-0324 TaxID=1037889 RepID=A0A921NRP4_9RHOB|nr:nicotinamide-nucleotide amidohydrolase family protein [Profundibacterium mesophilum]KAF0677482.1 putative competence-damaged inducible protein [Profundibacterium mesophilum KAUST100406-0324]